MAVASVLLITLLVPIGALLANLTHTSSQYKQSVVAQNYAIAELNQLRAEAAATNGFPPADVANATTSLTTLSGLTAGSIPRLGYSSTNTNAGLSVNNGTTYGIYVVGGWCSQSLTSPYSWGAYSSVPTNTKEPPAYWVGVIVVWNILSASVPANVTTSSTNFTGPYLVHTSPHLILTSVIATPVGDQSDDAITSPATESICPALLT